MTVTVNHTGITVRNLDRAVALLTDMDAMLEKTGARPFDHADDVIAIDQGPNTGARIVCMRISEPGVSSQHQRHRRSQDQDQDKRALELAQKQAEGATLGRNRR